jgi:hypothetical protein
MNSTTIETKEDMRSSALYGIQYLLNHIREDGSFVYEQNAKTGMVAETYNILRHAGCLYVLYQCMNEGLVSPRVALPLLEKATAYLQNAIKPFRRQPDLLALMEKQTAKLGGAALAIIALTERYRFRPEPDDLLLMRKLASFVVWMQQPDGHFRSKYNNRSAALIPFESGYYPGQAILALIRLYAIDPDPRWLQSAETGARYLLQHPVMEEGQPVNNHWFAIAITKLYFLNHDQELYRELCRLADICIGDIERRLPNEDATAGNAHYASSWATFGETLVAAMEVETRLGHPERVEYLRPYAQKLAEACLQLQIKLKEEPYKFYTLGAIRENEKSNRIRIDFVQHVLSVLIGLLPAEQSPTPVE